MTDKEAQIILIEGLLHSEETRIDFYLSKSKELEVRQTAFTIVLRKAFEQIRIFLTTPDTKSWGVDEQTGSIEDLIKLGESNLLTPAQYQLVLQSCKPFIGIFLNDYNNTIEMAEVLKDFWLIKWKHTNERPLFIDREFE